MSSSNTGKDNEQIQLEINDALAAAGQEQTATSTPGSKDGGSKDINQYQLIKVEALISKDVGCSFYLADYIIAGLGGFFAEKTGVSDNTIIISAQSSYTTTANTNRTKPRELPINVRPDPTAVPGAVYGKLVRVGKPITVPLDPVANIQQDYKGGKRSVTRGKIRVHPLMTVGAIAKFLRAFGNPPRWFRVEGGRRYRISGDISDAELGTTPPSLQKLVDRLKGT